MNTPVDVNYTSTNHFPITFPEPQTDWNTYNIIQIKSHHNAEDKFNWHSSFLSVSEDGWNKIRFIKSGTGTQLQAKVRTYMHRYALTGTFVRMAWMSRLFLTTIQWAHLAWTNSWLLMLFLLSNKKSSRYHFNSRSSRDRLLGMHMWLDSLGVRQRQGGGYRKVRLQGKKSM